MSEPSARDEAFEQGNIHLALGELENAVAAYRNAVAADDGFFDGWQALGMTLLKLEKVKEAIGCGIKASLLDPFSSPGQACPRCMFAMARLPKRNTPKPMPESSQWGESEQTPNKTS